MTAGQQQPPDDSSVAPGGTPAEERLHSLFARLRAGVTELTDADLRENFAIDEFPERIFRDTFALNAKEWDEFVVDDVRSPDPCVALAAIRTRNDTFHFGVRVEAAEPHRIRNALRCRALPGVVIRDAVDADAAALRAIELAAPIVVGDTRVVYDRGEDYFAAEQLMGNTTTRVIERDGRLVGLESSVLNAIRVNGRQLRGMYGHRLRLLPEARGQGMRELLSFVGFANESWRSDVPYAFIAAQNETMRGKSLLSGWSLRPERIVVDTHGSAGPAAGRSATPNDARRVVELLNAAHATEEMYVPYTVESLTARLQRRPDLYSWRHLRLGEQAVLGVWRAGLTVIRETNGITQRDIRALVLDYGCAPGAEGEMSALIRSECAHLASEGATELTIFTSPPSLAYAQLRAMAKRVEPYVLNLYLKEPDDLSRRGMYVDQLFF